MEIKKLVEKFKDNSMLIKGIKHRLKYQFCLSAAAFVLHQG
jgi:hypothetical protein